ncbi:hypothetical protein B0T19DRAFT_155773 [Cercophora scortea]|uniref:Uncharacterized protein n=1 Tax=Cercophora scortea TaxID=314031 RepID=A0AAE0MC96_9PEZI|nr:hypothetical protein B0T19DRAFT_155773 [Cercophora scortea]
MSTDCCCCDCCFVDRTQTPLERPKGRARARASGPEIKRPGQGRARRKHPTDPAHATYLTLPSPLLYPVIAVWLLVAAAGHGRMPSAASSQSTACRLNYLCLLLSRPPPWALAFPQLPEFGRSCWQSTDRPCAFSLQSISRVWWAMAKAVCQGPRPWSPGRASAGRRQNGHRHRSRRSWGVPSMALASWWETGTGNRQEDSLRCSPMLARPVDDGRPPCIGSIHQTPVRAWRVP